MHSLIHISNSLPFNFVTLLSVLSFRLIFCSSCFMFRSIILDALPILLTDVCMARVRVHAYICLSYQRTNKEKINETIKIHANEDQTLIEMRSRDNEISETMYLYLLCATCTRTRKEGVNSVDIVSNFIKK